jgi:hypothetical protein
MKEILDDWFYFLVGNCTSMTKGGWVVSIRRHQHVYIVDNIKISTVRKHKVKQVATVAQIIMLR